MLVDRESRLLELLDKRSLFLFDYDKMHFLTEDERKVVDYVVEKHKKNKLMMSSDSRVQTIFSESHFNQQLNALIEKDVLVKLPLFSLIDAFGYFKNGKPILPTKLDEATGYRLEYYRGGRGGSSSWKRLIESRGRNIPSLYVAKVAVKSDGAYEPSYKMIFSF